MRTSRTIAMAFLATVLLLAAATASRAGAAEDRHVEIWKGGSVFTKVVANVEFNGDKIHGVAYVFGLFGQKSTYHFKGTVRDGMVTARHHSGHTFQGELVSETKVKGVVTTRDGNTFTIEGERHDA